MGMRTDLRQRSGFDGRRAVLRRGAALVLGALLALPIAAPSVAADDPATPPATAPDVVVPTGPVVIKTGSFVAVDEPGSGEATIYQLTDGTYILRLENLSVTNGPDLRVRVGGPGGTLDLGGLKGNRGNQNYALPADFDPAQYDTADIWCRAFRSLFVVATLP